MWAIGPPNEVRPSPSEAPSTSRTVPGGRASGSLTCGGYKVEQLADRPMGRVVASGSIDERRHLAGEALGPRDDLFRRRSCRTTGPGASRRPPRTPGPRPRSRRACRASRRLAGSTRRTRPGPERRTTAPAGRRPRRRPARPAPARHSRPGSPRSSGSRRRARPARRSAASARPPTTIGSAAPCSGSGPKTKSSIWWKRPANGSLEPDQRCRHRRIVSSRYAPRTWNRSAHAEVRELPFVPADAETGDHPATAQRVERRELLGQQDRVPLRDDDDAGPEPKARMPRADPRERQDRLVDAAVLGLPRRGRPARGRSSTRSTSPAARPPPRPPRCLRATCRRGSSGGRCHSPWRGW